MTNKLPPLSPSEAVRVDEETYIALMTWLGTEQALDALGLVRSAAYAGAMRQIATRLTTAEGALKAVKVALEEAKAENVVLESMQRDPP